MECLFADISPSKLARIIIHVLARKKLECKSNASKAILDATIRILLSEDDSAIFSNGLDSEVANSISKALSKPQRSQNNGGDDDKKTNGITIEQNDPKKRPHSERPFYNSNINKSNKQPKREDRHVVIKTKEMPDSNYANFSMTKPLQESAPTKKIPLLPLPKDANPVNHQKDFLPIRTHRKVLLPFPPPRCKWTEETSNPTSKKENQYRTFYYQHPNLRNLYSGSSDRTHSFANTYEKSYIVKNDSCTVVRK